MAKKYNKSAPKQPASLRRLRKSGKTKSSTQQHVPFSEIRDGTVIMKDGTLRAVLLVSSLNFALKSEDEQKGIIQGYISFLNTIDFPLQITIESRRLNIEHYLEKMEQLEYQQENELLRRQTASYRSFIATLVKGADIMDKRFLVSIPFSPYSNKKKNYFSRLQEVLSPASVVKINQSKFEKFMIEMDRRIQLVVSGLQTIGLKSQLLDTQALIELLYNIYNPATKQQARIHDADKIQLDKTVQ